MLSLLKIFILIFSVPRNYDPALHPFEAPREYTRALNATKLDRVFAKPFVGNLEGHKDTISCLCKHPNELRTILSGSFDGEVKVWNLTQRTCEGTFRAYDCPVRGIAMIPDTDRFITVGNEIIKTWSITEMDENERDEPLNTIISNVSFFYFFLSKLLNIIKAT